MIRTDEEEPDREPYLSVLNRHLRPSPRSTDLAFNLERFVRRLEARRDHKPRPQYVAVLIDGGEPGFGKSTLGIHLCRRLDPEFNLDRFAFRGRDLDEKIAEAGRTRTNGFSMVQLDEPRDLMSRGGRKDDILIRIAAALGSCRKNGVGAVLVAPKKSWYDSFIRDGLIPYWVFLEEPGIGRLHRAWRGATYRTSQSRVQYDRTRIDRIAFDPLDGDPFFEAYDDLAVRMNWELFSKSGSERANRRGRGPAAAEDPDPPTGPERPMSAGAAARAGPLEPVPCRLGCGKAFADRRDELRHFLKAHSSG